MLFSLLSKNIRGDQTKVSFVFSSYFFFIELICVNKDYPMKNLPNSLAYWL